MCVFTLRPSLLAHVGRDPQPSRPACLSQDVIAAAVVSWRGRPAKGASGSFARLPHPAPVAAYESRHDLSSCLSSGSASRRRVAALASVFARCSKSQAEAGSPSSKSKSLARHQQSSSTTQVLQFSHRAIAPTSTWCNSSTSVRCPLARSRPGGCHTGPTSALRAMIVTGTQAPSEGR